MSRESRLQVLRVRCTAMYVMRLQLIIIQCVAMVTANQDTCPVVRYSGSFKADDHVSDHALFEHSYKNVTTSSSQECFNACVMGCACVAYQLSGTRCELMDEDRHTAPVHLHKTLGYKYYELKQKFLTPQQNIPAGCTGHCTNGCCRFVSCLNGGTCIEQCDDVKRKFKCQCRPEFTGKMCEKPMTCAAHGKGLISGLYPITLPSGDNIQVYCDFQSQPGFVWTLIESFAFANMLKYQSKSFIMDFPVNQDNHNWVDYRLSRLVMLHIRNSSRLFRATCKYDTDGLVMRDYIRGLLTNMDIMTYTNGSICAHVQYINVRGINCSECTTHFYQGEGVHPFVDSRGGHSLGCQWDGTKGSARVWTMYGYVYDDNFGFFGYHNLRHRCSSSSSSTTQWWLGTAVS